MDTTRDDLEGALSSVTDEEWRAAHERIRDDLVNAAGDGEAVRVNAQFTYAWAPDRDAATFTTDMRGDIAPERWRPGDPDERFDGGGFRG